MTIRSPLFIVFLMACGNTPAERPGPADPCDVATRLRDDALRQLASPNSCDADEDCVVISTAIECANVFLGDCGTLVNRATQGSLDWARTEREICEAVEGSDFGCAVNVSCAALAAPRCESGFCIRRLAAN